MCNISPVLPKHSYKHIMAYILGILDIFEHIQAGTIYIFVVRIEEFVLGHFRCSFLVGIYNRQMSAENDSLFYPVSR